MNERIRQIREMNNLSRQAFGERIGVSGDTINNIERGRSKIQGTIIKLICNEFNINRVWLETGEGEMKAPDSDSIAKAVADFLKEEGEESNSALAEFIENYLKLDEDNKKVIRTLIKALATKKDPE